MYDLEIIVPAELNEKNIFQRLQDFKKWGLQNTNGTKIKLLFLASSDNLMGHIKKLCSNWPTNFDVEGTITPYKDVAQKIMYYYNNIMKPDMARWYMRIDEDSMTDVNCLLTNLNLWFDHTRDYHVVGEVGQAREPPERHILKFLGFSWYSEEGADENDEDEYPWHECEISITSNSAIKKIIANPICKQMFNLREQWEGDHGDHMFAMAARVEKIYPTSVKFLTWHALPIRFSRHGGRYNHIHHIGRENNPYVEWLELTENNTNPKITDEITNRKYLLSFQNERQDYNVIFKKNGTIKRAGERDGGYSEEIYEIDDDIQSTMRNLSLVPFNSIIYGQPRREKILGIWGFTKKNELTVFLAMPDPEIYLRKTTSIATEFDLINSNLLLEKIYTNEKINFKPEKKSIQLLL